MPLLRHVLVSAILVLVAGAAVAGSAQAANYKMVLCAGNNGSNSFATATNTVSGANPGGIFEFHNYCGPAPDPAGNNAFLRINENQASGNAGETAYGSISWTVPPWIAILAAGGYTREPNAFNEGWRGRFWAEGFDGSTNNILMQGTGLPNSGIFWTTTSIFAPHLWPFSGYGYYRRFVFEMTCFRPAGCDRTNFNAVDANSFVLMLTDVSPSQVGLNRSGPFMTGQWTRGAQTVSFSWSDVGTGIRYERIRIDGNTSWAIDHASECDLGYSQQNGEFARQFSPCAQAAGIGRSYTFDTASLSDGAHTVQACTQDYAQWKGLDGTGGESCDQTTVHTDNTAPAKPAALEVKSANPQRYLSHFAAHWSLPSDPGSPIAKVHYDVIDAAGNVVTPAKVISATNPTELKEIEGPAQAGDYRLRVWLEDSVGLVGQPATIAIPHDTTPPAAPQDISVTAPNRSRQEEGFDLNWRNIVDAGSPVNAVHYEVLNSSGAVAVPVQTLAGSNVQAIPNLESPQDRGEYTLRMWLSDEEGNVGAPVSVPLAYQCVRSDASGGTALTSGLGSNPAGHEVVPQGTGSALHGSLTGAGASPVNGAQLCVFSQVVTDQEREFLGLATTAPDGGYRFPIAPGASRDLSVVYRRDHREVVSHATIETVVHPVLSVKKKVVYNHHVAQFFGSIPGPHNDRVVIVLQARVGKGWSAFRRYRTRDNGQFSVTYRFRHTFRPTKYTMRAQVRQTVGYPYLQGNSDRVTLLVLPHPPHRR